MSLTKRGEYWHCNFIGPGGEQIRRSLKTKNEHEAKEALARIQSELWRVKTLGERPKRSFDELCLLWLDEKSHKKSIQDDKDKIKVLRPLLGVQTIEQWNGELLRGVLIKQLPTSLSPATRNRYLALIRAMWRMAEQFGWIDKAPLIRGFTEPKRRIRWLTPGEASRLIDALPPHWQGPTKFALATGLRKSNVVNLRWNQIDMQKRVAWIHPDEAKAGRAIGVPLNQTAIDILHSQLGKNLEFVFVYQGRTLRTDSNTAWKNALQKAGITDFRFHDLRHTWASWLIQSGVGLAELQEMGGWESAQMVRRYAHLAPLHLQQHAEKLDSMIGGCSTKIAQK